MSGSGSTSGSMLVSSLQSTINSQLNQLSSTLSSILGQNPNLASTQALIQSQISLSEFALDSLADELGAAGGSAIDADLDAALATETLELDKLNALFEIQMASSGSGANDNGGGGMV